MLDEIKPADFLELASDLLPNGRARAFTLQILFEDISAKEFSLNQQVLRVFPVENV